LIFSFRAAPNSRAVRLAAAVPQPRRQGVQNSCRRCPSRRQMVQQGRRLLSNRPLATRPPACRSGLRYAPGSQFVGASKPAGSASSACGGGRQLSSAQKMLSLLAHSCLPRSAVSATRSAASNSRDSSVPCARGRTVHLPGGCLREQVRRPWSMLHAIVVVV